MRRQLQLMLIFFFFVSCQSDKIQYNQILGSWKMKDVVNNTGDNFSEKTTYYKDNKAVSEVWLNGKLTDKFILKYSIDKSKNILHLEFNKKYNSDFLILKLNRKELDLKDIKNNRITRNIRP